MATTYESEVVSLYTRLREKYKNLVDSKGVTIDTVFTYPNEDLTWVIDGEPLSGTPNEDGIDERLEQCERVTNGSQVSNNIDGTLNRLPKQLLSNDLAAKARIDSVSGGLVKSTNNAMLSLCRGFVNTITVLPNFNEYESSTYGIYRPSVFINSFNPTYNGGKTRRRFFADGLNFSPTISDVISLNLSDLVRPNGKYVIDVVLSMNNALESARRGADFKYKHTTIVSFQGFEDNPSITFNNISQSNMGDYSNNTDGWSSDMFFTTNYKGTIIVKCNRVDSDAKMVIRQSRGFDGIGLDAVYVTIQESVR